MMSGSLAPEIAVNTFFSYSRLFRMILSYPVLFAVEDFGCVYGHESFSATSILTNQFADYGHQFAWHLYRRLCFAFEDCFVFSGGFFLWLIFIVR